MLWLKTSYAVLAEDDGVIFVVTVKMMHGAESVFPIMASTTESVVLRWTRRVCLGRKTALVHSPGPGDAPQSIYSPPLLEGDNLNNLGRGAIRSVHLRGIDPGHPTGQL